MSVYRSIFLFIINMALISAEIDPLNTKDITTEAFMFWPNATIPFYVHHDHFDKEQSVAILSALSVFSFKTCLKFHPVMAAPKDNEHVMTFINPEGTKTCRIEPIGHSIYKPHTVRLGYDCLRQPQLNMMIMLALGFPFEHNRLSRDLYIKVLIENVENGAVELFTKDVVLPMELRRLPYDVNSVLHFGEREFSKNGHRTIVFKRQDRHPNPTSLTALDLKKIDIVYGPECRTRDRLEKIELCQSYPGVARKKREVEELTTLQNLRVNRNITPPPSVLEAEVPQTVQEENIAKSLKELGIDLEAQEVIDQVYKVSSKALKIAREKFCKDVNQKPELPLKIDLNKTEPGILSILALVTNHAKSSVENAIANLTLFCENPGAIETYQRQGCNWRFDSRCQPTYRSTKSGKVKYSTNHRPYIIQSTKHRGQAASYSYDKYAWRARNDSAEATTASSARRKRQVTEAKKLSPSKEKLEKEKQAVIEKLEKKESPKEEKRRFFEGRRYSPVKQDKPGLKWESSVSEEEKNTPKDSEDTSKSKEKQAKKKKNDPSLTIPNLFEGGNKKTSDVEKDISIEKKIKLDSDKEDSDLETTTERTTHRTKEVKTKDSSETEEERTTKAESKEKRSKKHKAPSGDVPETVRLTKLNKEFYHERRWPEGVMRYVISPLEGYDLDDMRSRLAEVARILKQKTCVEIKEITEEEAQNYEDYLVLDTSPDYVTGRVGGRQNFGCIELFKGGQHKQHAAMMVMAMLGFYFEVSRHDRDNYIRVHNRHIRPDKLHHFEKIRDEATFALPYDFKSAMHPAWQFWRKIGKTGISTVATYKEQDPDGSVMRELGQHDELLSKSDIIKINSIYGVDCFTDDSQRDDGSASSD
ncbi:uncharacterized protein LOC142985559 isoform X2 [Anticarsia gemmatalis]|uniref:uncharacterized protein LOC142985559 isoform X2 n=1 Tax=Anticarsia gemmatalis TaxID=129554 RepID=UPI003F769335